MMFAVSPQNDVVSCGHKHKKKDTMKIVSFFLELVDGLDRLLRILPACRPNALRSVPDFTLCAKKLPPATFLNAQTLSGSSP